MRGQKHSDEVRGQALAALLEGQGVTEVAKKYKLPKSTVQDIKRSIESENSHKFVLKKNNGLLN